jgi:excisionase family DNA binding protein
MSRASSAPPAPDAAPVRLAWRVDELAQALRVSRRTIERAIRDGRLVSTRRLGARLVSAESVRALFGEVNRD